MWTQSCQMVDAFIFLQDHKADLRKLGFVQRVQQWLMELFVSLWRKHWYVQLCSACFSLFFYILMARQEHQRVSRYACRAGTSEKTCLRHIGETLTQQSQRRPGIPFHPHFRIRTATDATFARQCTSEHAWNELKRYVHTCRQHAYIYIFVHWERETRVKPQDAKWEWDETDKVSSEPQPWLSCKNLGLDLHAGVMA